MTLRNFIKMYRGGATLSIKGYCEETRYDYYLLPDKDVEDFSGNNPNGYVPSCLAREPWWEEVKNRQVLQFGVIAGGTYTTELCIYLEGDNE